MNTLRSIFVMASVALLSVATIPAQADEVIPEEWIGVWELDFDIYDCDTEQLIFSSTALDTICLGSVFEDPDPGSTTVECTSSIDGTTYTNHCEGVEEDVLPGCDANFVFDILGTRNGDSFTQTTTSVITYTGDCPPDLDSCQRIETTGTRINTPGDPCESTPVVSLPWATVKASYR